MTFGRTLNKALKSAGISTTFSQWHKHAQNRDMWRSRCYQKSNINDTVTKQTKHFNHNYNLRSHNIRSSTSTYINRFLV